jgi:hypothetical protein
MNEMSKSKKAANVEKAGCREFSAPLGQVEQAQLEIVRGISQACIRGQRMTEELYRARFEGMIPAVREKHGVVSILYPQLSPIRIAANLIGGRQESANIILNGAVTWQIVINGGAWKVTADLRQLDLRAFEVLGGASDIELMLPQPLGTVIVRVSEGASSVRLYRPVGVAASVSIASGASRLKLDDHALGAIGGNVHLETPDYHIASNRYQIEVLSGASNLSITTL